MSERDLMGVASTAKLGGHPIHPMLVPFPIAFLVGALLCDLGYWFTGSAFAAQMAMWSLGAGIVGGAAAALAGLADFTGNERIRGMSDAWQHMIGNVIAVALAIISFWLRWRYGAAESVLPWGLLLSAVTVALLLFTGWKGGELVYRYRVGVHPEAPSGSARS